LKPARTGGGRGGASPLRGVRMDWEQIVGLVIAVVALGLSVAFWVLMSWPNSDR